MRVYSALSVLVPVMIVGCGQRSESAAVQRLEPRSVSSVSLRTHSAVGCWNFVAVGYRGYARMPEFVQLSAKYRVTAQGDTIGQALLDAAAKGPGLGFAYWIPINANTIDLSWSDGLTGVEVQLVGRDTLVGTPADWTDLDTKPRPSGQLTLRRAACSRATFTHGMWSDWDNAGKTVRER